MAVERREARDKESETLSRAAAIGRKRYEPKRGGKQRLRRLFLEQLRPLDTPRIWGRRRVRWRAAGRSATRHEDVEHILNKLCAEPQRSRPKGPWPSVSQLPRLRQRSHARLGGSRAQEVLDDRPFVRALSGERGEDREALSRAAPVGSKCDEPK